MKDIATFFAALADPTRLRLLRLMRDGEICVCFLQEVLRTNQPRISRHLGYLRKAGLVTARKDGKWMHYSLAKQKPGLQQILVDTFDCLNHDPEIKRDLKRLNSIRCCPAEYGLPQPSSKLGI